jgi:hypothetical protein
MPHELTEIERPSTGQVPLIEHDASADLEFRLHSLGADGSAVIVQAALHAVHDREHIEALERYRSGEHTAEDTIKLDLDDGEARKRYGRWGLGRMSTSMVAELIDKHRTELDGEFETIIANSWEDLYSEMPTILRHELLTEDGIAHIQAHAASRYLLDVIMRYREGTYEPHTNLGDLFETVLKGIREVQTDFQEGHPIIVARPKVPSYDFSSIIELVNPNPDDADPIISEIVFGNSGGDGLSKKDILGFRRYGQWVPDFNRRWDNTVDVRRLFDSMANGNYVRLGDEFDVQAFVQKLTGQQDGGERIFPSQDFFVLGADNIQAISEAMATYIDREGEFKQAEVFLQELYLSCGPQGMERTALTEKIATEVDWHREYFLDFLAADLRNLQQSNPFYQQLDEIRQRYGITLEEIQNRNNEQKPKNS